EDYATKNRLKINNTGFFSRNNPPEETALACGVVPGPAEGYETPEVIGYDIPAILKKKSKNRRRLSAGVGFRFKRFRRSR
ncbi:unnamed protein product, partial [marine sediment metagenome]